MIFCNVASGLSRPSDPEWCQSESGGCKTDHSDSSRSRASIASRFSGRSDSAKLNAEMLGPMVNDPNVGMEELKAIRAETLVISGSKDMIRESHTRLIAECIPYSQFVIINGDHCIANKDPEEFNRVVLEFIKGQYKAFEVESWQMFYSLP